MRSTTPVWPLTVVAVGLPMWWVLGLAELIFPLAAIPMAFYLLRQSRIRLPPYFGVWLGFLAVVLCSGLVLEALAPYAQPSTIGSAVLTFGYRFALYLAATTYLVYVVNLPRDSQVAERLGDALAAIFTITVAGGILGMALPTLEFATVLERLLPGSLSSTTFVTDLVHAKTADIQTVLGYPEPRPKAPFAFANSWGANFTATLPFFVWRFFGGGASPARKGCGVVVLLLGSAPVVYSLNRGLWIAIGLAIIVFATYYVRRAGSRAILPLTAAIVVGSVIFVVSPLAGIVQQRLDSPHSNERRGDLASITLDSVNEGSPVLGFGNTRRLQGSFTSIAGGATVQCPLCAVPPLGTQGHFWLVIFSQGWLGVVLFYGFFAASVARAWRQTDPVTVACVAALVPLMFETLAYDTLGSPFLIAMLATGMLARPWWSPPGSRAPESQAPRRLRHRWYVPVTGAVVGAVLGGVLLASQPRVSLARASVLIPSNAAFLTTAFDFAPRAVTVDTEAQLGISEETIGRAEKATGVFDATYAVTAEPRSRVVVFTATAPSRTAAARAADGLAAVFVEEHDARRAAERARVIDTIDDSIARLREEQDDASPAVAAAIDSSIGTKRVQRDDAMRTLIVDARQLGSARASAVSRQNPEVPVASGLALGLVLGGAGAALLPPRRRRSPGSTSTLRSSDADPAFEPVGETMSRRTGAASARV